MKGDWKLEDAKANMCPLFPRLHVNDAEKGGPRAPPRNKMALYEQFSVPTQRSSSVVSNSSGLVPSTLMRQDGGRERAVFSPISYAPPIDKFQSYPLDLSNRSSPRTNSETKTLVSIANNPSRIVEKLSSHHPNIGSCARHPIEGREGDGYEVPTLVKSDVRKSRKHKSRLVEFDTALVVKNMTTENSFLNQTRKDRDPNQLSFNQDRYQNPKTTEKCNETTENGRKMFLQTVEGELIEDSDTSVVDSMSGLEISPDDVVGVIGQEHFWKARKAIVNQQRIFAKQIFELHRLIKVQKLMAGAPHLLYESHSQTSRPLKPSITPLPSKRKATIKARAAAVEHKNDNPKASNSANKVPGQLDNVITSTGVACQSRDKSLLSLNPQPNGISENKAGSLCFPPSNQWLVPVISPLEGLVYKPFPGPFPPPGVLMAPMYGGCGPVGLPAMAGDFMGNSQSGLGLFPHMPSYFPHPCGYPVMNTMNPTSTVEQALPAPQGEQCSTEVGYNIHSKDSSNASNKKNHVMFPTSKDSGVQFSTGSSPSDRWRKKAGGALQKNAVLPLFPIAPISERLEGIISSKSNEIGSRVIKVVPHNRKSASESAARIFQSIQAGRGSD